jgi:hypothetical protein
VIVLDGLAIVVHRQVAVGQGGAEVVVEGEAGD